MQKTLQAVVDEKLNNQIRALAGVRGQSVSSLVRSFVTKGVFEIAHSTEYEAQKATMEEHAQLEEALVATGCVTDPDDAQFAIALLKMYLGEDQQETRAKYKGLPALEAALMRHLAQHW